MNLRRASIRPARSALCLTVLASLTLFGIVSTPTTVQAQACTTPVNVACVGFDDSGFGTGVNTSVLSWTNQNVTQGGINRALVVGIAYRLSSFNCPPPTLGPTTSTVNWSVGATTQTLTRVSTQDNNSTPANLRAEMWILLNPTETITSGTGTVTVTLQTPCTPPLTAAADIVGVSFSATGVDTSSVGAAIASSNIGLGNSSSPNNSFTAQPAQRLIVGFAASPGNFLMDPDQTNIPDQFPQFTKAIGATPTSIAVSSAVRRGAGGAPFQSSFLAWVNRDATNAPVAIEWLAGLISLNPRVITDVGFTKAEASSYTNGTLVGWRTGFEADNLGFDVYRDRDGIHTRITPDIVAGSSLFMRSGALSSGYSYAWWDAEGIPGDSYWIESVDLQGKRTEYGPITPQRGMGGSPVRTSSPTLGKLGLGGSSAGVSMPVSVGVTPDFLNSEPISADKGHRSARSAWATVPGQAAMKVGVRQDGWYRLTQQDLIAANLNPGQIDPRNIHVFADGQEIPVIVRGESDGHFDAADTIEFFGTGVDVQSTDTRVYWVMADTTRGTRIKSSQGRLALGNAASFPATVQLKERLVYFAALANGDTENFFGRTISSAPVDHLLQMPNADPAGSGGQVEIALQGVTDEPHSVSVKVNSVQVGTIAFEGKTRRVQTLSVPQSAIANGPNVVTLTGSGVGADVSVVDYVRATYTHKAMADQNSAFIPVNLGAGRIRAVSVDGFTTPQVQVYDVTNPANVQGLASQITPSSNGNTLTVMPLSTSQTLYAFTNDQIKRPEWISSNLPSHLTDPANVADIVVITHRDFTASLAPLVSLRQSQGYRVSVVDIDDIYDEFGYGYHSPLAVRDFLSNAKTSWAVSPRFVLLVGDATLDPRNYFGLGNADFVPTKLVDTDVFEAASDDWAADFDGDAIPDMAVGRLPVSTPTQAAALVTKIVSYDTTGRGNASALLVRDQTEVEDFDITTAQIRQLLPSSFAVNEVARGVADDSVTHQQVLSGINAGPGIVNYIGHGSVDLWRGDTLTTQDSGSFINGGDLSLFVVGNCLNGYFHDPLLESLGESVLKASNGGAVAVWASSGITSAFSQRPLIQEFYRQLFANPGMTMGEAAARAKAAGSTDTRRSWIFLGDPATRLQ